MLKSLHQRAKITQSNAFHTIKRNGMGKTSNGELILSLGHSSFEFLISAGACTKTNELMTSCSFLILKCLRSFLSR